eukprot:scaffold1220_cov259-Pinguiococcus_pyrenoidosus.AAC.71
MDAALAPLGMKHVRWAFRKPNLHECPGLPPPGKRVLGDFEASRRLYLGHQRIVRGVAVWAFRS